MSEALTKSVFAEYCASGCKREDSEKPRGMPPGPPKMSAQQFVFLCIEAKIASPKGEYIYDICCKIEEAVNLKPFINTVISLLLVINNNVSWPLSQAPSSNMSSSRYTPDSVPHVGARSPMRCFPVL